MERDLYTYIYIYWRLGGEAKREINFGFGSCRACEARQNCASRERDPAIARGKSNNIGDAVAWCPAAARGGLALCWPGAQCFFSCSLVPGSRLPTAPVTRFTFLLWRLIV